MGSSPMDKALMRDVVEWDVGTWSEAIRFWKTVIAHAKAGARCLELGARAGGLSLWLALSGFDVVCSDVRDSEKNAAPLHQKYGVSSSIRYEDIDASDIPYANHFDYIAFKSILGVVGYHNNKAKQQKAIDQMLRALQPGGKLLFAENLAGMRLHRWARERFVRWGTAWRYVTVNEIREFLKPYASFEVHTTGVIALFGRTHRQRGVLSFVDHLLLNRFCPDSWKYVVYGVATK